MKAIRVSEFGGAEVMRLEEVPDLKPGRGEVLIDVRAAGVNPVDTYIREGRYSFRPKLPYTPGMDEAGIVEAVGKGVEGVRAGDRVYTAGTISGAYAEKVLCKQTQVHRLPEKISFSAGAALGVPYGAAYRGLFQVGKATEGDVVLIHGASGAVGIAAVQLAKAAGMTVIGTAGTDRGLKLANEQGAEYAVNHHEEGHLQKVLEWTEGRGVDVVLEMLANENLNKDLAVMAMRGHVVVIGSRGTVEIDPRLAMKREVSIIGTILMNATEQETAEIYAGIEAGLEDGSLRPVVGLELPLSEAAQAHHIVIESSSYGKIVLIP